MSQNEYYEQFFEFIPCPKCKGRRLRDEVLAVTVGGLSVDALCSLSIDSALDFVNALKLTKTEEAIARDIVKELRSQPRIPENVGLGYLNPVKKGGHSVRRRIPEDQTGNADRLVAHGSALYP